MNLEASEILNSLYICEVCNLQLILGPSENNEFVILASVILEVRPGFLSLHSHYFLKQLNIYLLSFYSYTKKQRVRDTESKIAMKQMKKLSSESFNWNTFCKN